MAKDKRPLHKNIRGTREYRLAMVNHRRVQPRCVICNSLVGRVVHHIECVRYAPDLACDEDNLVTLCDHRGNDCHKMYHIAFLGSYQKKATKKTFSKFMEIVNHSKQIMKQESSN